MNREGFVKACYEMRGLCLDLAKYLEKQESKELRFKVLDAVEVKK